MNERNEAILVWCPPVVAIDSDADEMNSESGSEGIVLSIKWTSPKLFLPINVKKDDRMYALSTNYKKFRSIIFVTDDTYFTYCIKNKHYPHNLVHGINNKESTVLEYQANYELFFRYSVDLGILGLITPSGVDLTL